jgi:CBS domain-containing protein
VNEAASADIPIVRLVTHASTTVGTKERVEQVYGLMSERGERFVAVRQGRRITAVLDREHVRARLAAARGQLLVRDIVHPGMACLPADATVGAAARLMRVTGSLAVPVVDGLHRLIGLVTAEDVTNALA